MCGIAGFVGRHDSSVLTKMVSSLTHRGPDDAGYWNDGQVFLGMRRLSIVDLATGQQPVFNEDETIVVVFNGEIYNHAALREQLVSQGHVFRSDHSDTEVIVHLYEQYGDRFVTMLNGMFAIALWDMKQRRLLLVRDHIGIKPLYYSVTPSGGIAFGSEPKAVLHHPEMGREPDYDAIHHYFSLKSICAPQSAYRQISQLEPGQSLVFTDGSTSTTKWWTPQFTPRGGRSPDGAPAQLLNLLEDSVRLQMQADVPFGAYLSGGVDSSAVVALMSRNMTARVKTFTLAYDDADLPNKDADRRYAREVSDLFGTEHHERVIRHTDLLPAIDKVIEAFDEPFSGVISTYFLTELISQHVKVALSGDGADELFGSYAPHRLAQTIMSCDQNAGEEPTTTTAGLPKLSAADANLARMLAQSPSAVSARMQLTLMTEGAKQALYSPRMRGLTAATSTEQLLRRKMESSGGYDPLNRMLHLDQETLLPDQVLSFVDRLSMAHSVEVRPPFLDHRIIEFANNLPAGAKISDGRNKAVLKEALQGILPNEVLDRPKEGFLMPINYWLSRYYMGWLSSILSTARLARHGLLNAAHVAELLARFKDQPDNKSGDRLWNIAMFQLWWERYVYA
jgi:asparagine synthase (glutamine-hydrolysing)